MRAGHGYFRLLGLLTIRDLKVRFSAGVLGYLWILLEPLLMAAIYYVVFAVVIRRSVGEDPYILYLIIGVFAWSWFRGAVGDSATSLIRDAKLVRSTRVPRTLWVLRRVCSKGLEFLLTIPIVVVIALGTHTLPSPLALLWPIAIVWEGVLITGLGLLLAPLTVLVRDLEQIVRVVLTAGFYASPIIYSLSDLAHLGLEYWGALNPLSGILVLYRSAFFPEGLSWPAVGISAAVTLAILLLGVVVWRRTMRTVLKEI